MNLRRTFCEPCHPESPSTVARASACPDPRRVCAPVSPAAIDPPTVIPNPPPRPLPVILSGAARRFFLARFVRVGPRSRSLPAGGGDPGLIHARRQNNETRASRHTVPLSLALSLRRAHHRILVGQCLNKRLPADSAHYQPPSLAIWIKMKAPLPGGHPGVPRK